MIACADSPSQELVDRIPAECNLDLMHGIHFSKGCYIGQELCARTQFKGNVRKRVVPVMISQSAKLDVSQAILDFNEKGCIPDDGECRSALQLDGKKVGNIIACQSGIGVAQVRLDALISQEALKSEDGEFSVIPVTPSWWPSLDASGKCQTD